MASLHRAAEEGIEIFERFEIEFQLDGHFWLQYGLFLIKLNKYDNALGALTRSIAAYPENPYAQHALAHLKLRIALQRRDMDSTTQELIDSAVEALQLLHTRSTPTDDQYPLVTLSIMHVQVLHAHNRRAEATAAARRYYGMLQEMGRRVQQEAIARAAEAMLRYVTMGEAPGRLFGPAANPVRRRKFETRQQL